MAARLSSGGQGSPLYGLDTVVNRHGFHADSGESVSGSLGGQ
jgi:hypothetical protein